MVFPRRVLSVVCALLLLLVTGASTPIVFAEQPTSREVNPVPDLTRAYAVVAAHPLEWEPCEEMFECATLTVPLDYSGKVPGTTTLALVRLPAAEPENRIGTLVFNPGGPGGSATEMLVNTNGEAFSREQRRHFDIVAMDPRGIGRSNPISCGLGEAGIDMYALAAGDPSVDEEWDLMLEIAQQIAELCAENAGPLLPFMGTHELTIDFEMLRYALGEKQLSFVMFSYGTQVGALFAERFPRSVRAMVLDSAVDLNIDGLSEIKQQAAGREEVFNNFLEQCSLTTACPFFENGNPAGAWNELIEDLERMEGPNAEEGLLMTQTLRQLSRLAAHQQMWGFLAALLVTIKHTDLETLQQAMDVVQTTQEEDVAPGDDDPLDEPEEEGIAFTAVECLDWQFTGSTEELRQAAIELRTEVSPKLLADMASWLPCHFWPASPSLRPAPVRAEGAPPILVVGNTMDQATPYHWSVSIAGQLESARLLTRIGVGHIASERSQCVDTLIDKYLIRLTPPAAGAVCPSNPVETTWHVPDFEAFAQAQ